jgi:hypothetical protein
LSFGRCNRYKDGETAYCSIHGYCGPKKTHGVGNGRNTEYDSNSSMCALNPNV